MTIIDQLTRISDRCFSPNWDCEGASAINRETIDLALDIYRFGAIPGFDIASACPSPDGSIALSNADESVVVTVWKESQEILVAERIEAAAEEERKAVREPGVHVNCRGSEGKAMTDEKIEALLRLKRYVEAQYTLQKMSVSGTGGEWFGVASDALGDALQLLQFGAKRESYKWTFADGVSAYISAKVVISNALMELLHDSAGDVSNRVAEAVIARLAAHDPPILLQMEKCEPENRSSAT